MSSISEIDSTYFFGDRLSRRDEDDQGGEVEKQSRFRGGAFHFFPFSLDFMALFMFPK
jgi:hypothetical protein